MEEIAPDVRVANVEGPFCGYNGRQIASRFATVPLVERALIIVSG
jgi:hypothetical protein